MGEQIPARRRWLRAAAALAVGAVVVGCAGERETAAPVILKGAGPDRPDGIEAMPAAVPPRPRVSLPPSGPGKRIVVQPGQSVSKLSRQYSVSKRAIIEANRLPPPYKIEIGQLLVIPGAADPTVREAAKPAEAPAEPRQAAAAKPPAWSETARSAPEIIPLDNPAPAPKAMASLTPPPPPAIKPAPPQPASGAAAKSPPENAPEPRRTEAAPPEPASRSRHLLWPVRGRIVAGYGASQGGGHNDGINIAAPRGTAIRAVEAGTVAYAGNEIRGYGNLVLVKHANGFISAYAHADALLVKRGDKVKRGQVIGKVGTTGGVAEPQLHFELRRGKRAVDPREFLAPASSAGAAADKERG